MEKEEAVEEEEVEGGVEEVDSSSLRFQDFRGSVSNLATMTIMLRKRSRKRRRTWRKREEVEGGGRGGRWTEAT